MSGPHTPFEQRTDVNGNMHYDPIINRVVFDRTPKGLMHKQVLEKVFDEESGEYKGVAANKQPLQALFNPKTKRFDLVDRQTIFDPNEKHITQVCDDIAF